MTKTAVSISNLMLGIALIGLAVFQVTRPIEPRNYLVPALLAPDASLLENALRIAWFAGVPLLAIAWRRRRGERGILAGLVAGIASYSAYVMFLDRYFPHRDPFSLGTLADCVIFAVVGGAHGLILGIAAWGLGWARSLVEAAHRRSRKCRDKDRPVASSQADGRIR